MNIRLERLRELEGRESAVVHNTNYRIASITYHHTTPPLDVGWTNQMLSEVAYNACRASRRQGPHSTGIEGARGLLRPSCDQWRQENIETVKNETRVLGPFTVPSWEESRAHWKERLEAETMEDWIAQDCKRRGLFSTYRDGHRVGTSSEIVWDDVEDVVSIAEASQ
jgi:hypothetical protein